MAKQVHGDLFLFVPVMVISFYLLDLVTCYPESYLWQLVKANPNITVSLILIKEKTVWNNICRSTQFKNNIKITNSYHHQKARNGSIKSKSNKVLAGILFIMLNSQTLLLHIHIIPYHHCFLILHISSSHCRRRRWRKVPRILIIWRSMWKSRRIRCRCRK